MEASCFDGMGVGGFLLRGLVFGLLGRVLPAFAKHTAATMVSQLGHFQNIGSVERENNRKPSMVWFTSFGKRTLLVPPPKRHNLG